MSNSFDTEISFIPTTKEEKDKNGGYKTLEEVLSENDNRQPHKKTEIIDLRPRIEKKNIINFIPTIEK